LPRDPSHSANPPTQNKKETTWHFDLCTAASWSNASRAKTRLKAAIIIPDTVKEKPQDGKIIAVGPGGRDETGKLIPLDVKAGDRILFGKWSGTEVKIDGDDLLIMKESDILGVVA